MDNKEIKVEKKSKHLKEWAYIVLDNILLTFFIMSATINFVINDNLKIAVMHYVVVGILTVKLYMDLRKLEKVSGYGEKEKGIQKSGRDSASVSGRRKRRNQRNRI